MKIHWFDGFVVMILMVILMWSATSELPIHTKEIIYVSILVIGFSTLGFGAYRKRQKQKAIKTGEQRQ